jgi:hypothetical protein
VTEQRYTSTAETLVQHPITLCGVKIQDRILSSYDLFGKAYTCTLPSFIHTVVPDISPHAAIRAHPTCSSAFLTSNRLTL